MTVQQLAVRVRAEFAEMPDLCLTPTQAHLVVPDHRLRLGERARFIPFPVGYGVNV